MPWFLFLCLPLAASLLPSLSGCCGGNKRDSQRTITSRKEVSRPDKKFPGQKMKAKTNSRQQEVHTQQPQPKDGEEAKVAVAAEGGGSGKDAKKESKRGVSKKGKDPSVEPTQNVTRSDEEAQKEGHQQPQQEQNRTQTEIPAEPAQPEVKLPNEFEKAAAVEGMVINPDKVKRLGNIDEIHDARREQEHKELEALKSQVSKSIKGSKEKEGRKVTINEGKCVLYETADCPTIDDEADNENGEDPI